MLCAIAYIYIIPGLGEMVQIVKEEAEHHQQPNRYIVQQAKEHDRHRAVRNV